MIRQTVNKFGRYSGKTENKHNSSVSKEKKIHQQRLFSSSRPASATGQCRTRKLSCKLLWMFITDCLMRSRQRLKHHTISNLAAVFIKEELQAELGQIIRVGDGQLVGFLRAAADVNVNFLLRVTHFQFNKERALRTVRACVYAKAH